MMFAILACLCGAGHAYAATDGYIDLYETLGINTECAGAVKPSCSVPVTKINAGLCYNWYCPDASRCVSVDMVTCPDAQTAQQTGLDDAGCPLFSCVQADCPVVKACDTGYAPTNRGVDSNGCATFDCAKVQCATEASISCDTGYATKVQSTDENGCNVYACVSTDGTDGTDGTTCATPESLACAAGYEAKARSTDANGCSVYACAKSDEATCPAVATCAADSKAVTETDANGCTVLKECTKVMLGDGKGSSGSSSGSGSVSGSTVTCAKPKACASGKTAVYGKDKNNCAVLKSCEAKCPPLPTCGENGGWLDLHKDKNGCSVGHCERRWNR